MNPMQLIQMLRSGQNPQQLAMFSYETNLTVEQEELLADLIATYGQEIISKTNDIFQRLKANKGDLSS